MYRTASFKAHICVYVQNMYEIDPCTHHSQTIDAQTYLQIKSALIAAKLYHRMNVKVSTNIYRQSPNCHVYEHTLQ